jgi:hypothetical protein
MSLAVSLHQYNIVVCINTYIINVYASTIYVRGVRVHINSGLKMFKLAMNRARLQQCLICAVNIYNRYIYIIYT